MSVISLLTQVLRAVLPRADHGLVDELRELHRLRVRAAGRVRADAWYARQVAGFVVRLQLEQFRQLVRTPDTWRTELRQGARAFVRQRSYAWLFAATLGLGVGGIAAIAGAAQWLLLRPVAGVHEPDALLTLRLVSREAPPHVFFTISQPDLETLRATLPVASLASSARLDVHVRTGAHARRVSAEVVSGNYFDVLGARPLAGRSFAADEEFAAGDVIILSHALARTIAADAGAVVGRDVAAGGRTYRVIGVMPRGFRGAERAGTTDVWFTPAALPHFDSWVQPDFARQRGAGVWGRLYARARPQVPAAAVHAAAERTMARVRAEHRMHSFLANHFQFEVTPGIGLDPGEAAGVRRALTLLGGAALLLLLLCVANVANLSMIRATALHRDTAVRLALGASRLRVARALWLESLLLGAAGGVVAFGVALVMPAAFAPAMTDTLAATFVERTFSLPVLLAALACALFAASLAGMQPALVAGRDALERTLRRRGPDDAGSQRLRAALVTAQVALSMMLLIGAGLLGRTVSNLRNIELGFDPAGLVTFYTEPGMDGLTAERADAAFAELERELGAGAGWIAPAALRPNYLTASLEEPGRPDERVIGAGFFVSPGFLDALGVRTLAGDRQWRADPGTVVITRKVAEALFPMTPLDALPGRELLARGDRLRLAAIVEDVQLADITRAPPPIMFRPLAERYDGIAVQGMVRGRTAAAVERVLQERASGVTWFDLGSVRDVIGAQFTERQLLARVAITLCLLGLALAAVGLYGVLAWSVTLRRRELAITMALGAAPAEVRTRVVRSGLLLTLVGAIMGAAVSVAFARMLRSHLFGLSPLDTPTYVAAMLVLIAAATLAALLPANRAARTAPAEVLRAD